MFRILPCLLPAVVAIHQGQGHRGHGGHEGVSDVRVIDASASTSSKLSNHSRDAVLETPESSHLVRREHVAAVEPTRKLTYMALGATGLVGYLAFLASTSSSAASKEAEPEDRSLLGAWPTALQWMMLSMTLSIFNKWIFLPEGANFPFPMTLSCCHMLATGLLLQLLRWAQPQFFPGLQGFDENHERRRKLAKVVLLVGALLSVSVVLSNSAAMLLSVAFVNMLKSGNPVLALLLGLSLGTSSCNWRMLCPLLMMMLGVLATIHGELFLSYLGLALLVMAILIEQFRLVIFKSLMSDSGFSLDPLSAVALFSPVAFIFTFAAAATYEWHSFWTAGRMDVLQGSALVLNSLVAVTLNIAYSRLLKVASPVTFTVFGTAKDVATAGLSLTLVGGTVTTQQLCGYGTALVGMIYYDRVKRNA